MVREPMIRQAVVNAIERRGEHGVPLFWHKAWGIGLEEKYGARLKEIADTCPDDIVGLLYNATVRDVSTNSNPAYRWGYTDYSCAERHNIDRSVVLLPDWRELDAFLKDLPNPNEAGTFKQLF